MAKYRIAIVGCGGIAHRHIQGYRLLGERCEVVAGCDPREETLTAYCNCYNIPLRYTNTDDLIASGEANVISLLTPPAARAEVIFPALENGYHLLVEKPFSESLADAISFVEAAEKAGVVLAVNQQTRWYEDILTIRDEVTSGELGELVFIRHDHFQNRTNTTGWRSLEERLEISIFSIHVLDRLRWLSQRPIEAVSCVTRHTGSGNPRGEVFTALTMQFADGLVGTMVSNWLSLELPSCELRIDGTKGSLVSRKRALLSDEADLTIAKVGQPPETRHYRWKDPVTQAMGESMRRLLDAADSGEQPAHSGQDNLETMAIVDGAYLSTSRGGALVTRDEIFPREP